MKSYVSVVIEWINVVAICFLGASLVLPSQYQTPALYFYAVSMLFDVFCNKRWQDVRPLDRYRWVFIPMILYYLCIWVWHPFEESNMPLFKYTAENRLPFLIFGVLGLFTNINPRFKPQQLAVTMSVSGIIATVWLLLRSNLFVDVPHTIEEYQQVFAAYRVRYVGSHMTFNLFMNTSLVMLVYSLMNVRKNIWKGVYIVLLVFVYLILLTTEGRTGFATANILVSVLICCKIWKYNKYMFAPVFVLCIIAGGILVNNQTRFKQMDVIDNPRKYIWQTTVEVIEERPVFGYGVSDGRKAFVDYGVEDTAFCDHYYTSYVKSRPEDGKYVHHPHNMMLNSMLEFGIVGLLLFLSLFVLPLLTLKGGCRFYVLLICLTFGFQAMMESPGQHLPPMMYCWFVYLFTLFYHPHN